jgi:two-component system KDP operon response regulator KdpE
MTRVLVVDDEPQIVRGLRTNLVARGYVVDTAADGETALDLAARHRPDVVIVDLGLPGIDGVEVIRGLRTWTAVPIIVLSAREQESEKVDALDAGADDYVTKPFSVDELLARLRAVLRRRTSEQEPVVTIGDLEIDIAQRVVTVRGERVKLSPHEFDLLRVLAQNRGKLLTHSALLREVWGPAYQVEAHYLHVYVSHLRKKIEPDPSSPRYILTEPGAGYRLVDPADARL